MNQFIEDILEHLAIEKSLDFSGYNNEFVEQIFDRRRKDTQNETFQEYQDFFQNSPEEPDALVSALTINVSEFFRNPYIFHYLAEKVLPSLIAEKKRQGDVNLRVWSAGCAFGEEPYSLALLIDEIVAREKIDLTSQLFATDIDRKSLHKAQKGVFHSDRIGNVPHRLLVTNFVEKNNNFHLNQKIRDLVHFLFHDLLDTKTLVPPESIFGNFDFVLCRNVLIYFKPHYQKMIFDKLFNALAVDGFLLLGKTENLPQSYSNYFTHLEGFPLYRKRG